MHKHTSKATKGRAKTIEFDVEITDYSNGELAAPDPWAQLDAIMAKEQEPVGPEWFTQDEFEKRYNIHHKAAWARLNEMTKAGTLESWVGLIRAIKRRGRKYRFKEAQ